MIPQEKAEEAANKCLSTLNLIKSREYDPDGGHACADTALCNLLDALGYKEIVSVYDSLPKYYS